MKHESILQHMTRLAKRPVRIDDNGTPMTVAHGMFSPHVYEVTAICTENSHGSRYFAIIDSVTDTFRQPSYMFSPLTQTVIAKKMTKLEAIRLLRDMTGGGLYDCRFLYECLCGQSQAHQVIPE